MSPTATLSTPLLLASHIRGLEHGHTGLMEKAGLAAAELARDLAGDSGRILVLAGPGNNGGDAFVAARRLKGWWFDPCVVFRGDVSRLPPDAAAAHAAWLAAGGTIVSDIPAGRFDLVVDGLFGVGLAKPPAEPWAALIAQANALATPILALDVPSGLDADSGHVPGSAIRATHTLTFLGLKPGLYTGDGPDHAGTVHLADLDIGTDSAAAGTIGELLDRPPALPAPRRRNSHKGDFGDVGVLGGTESMVGAAILAARAALLCGSGRVYAGLLASCAPAVDLRQPELMLRSADQLLGLARLDVLAVGPGLGRSEEAQAALSQALAYPAALVLDADALNLLAASSELRGALACRASPAILTPHPGEAATLLGTGIAEVQSDRIGSACKLAAEFNAVVVLKGCGSVIAAPDGRWCVNASGNPGMASAGMGDVLAGILAGLIAQDMNAWDAARLGVHLHGAAADRLAKQGAGPLGLTASEVAEAARGLLNQWITTA